MRHEKWEAYLSICRKVETGGRNADGCEDPAIIAEHQGFVDHFKRYLPPQIGGRPAKILAPGAISEALLLAAAGYEVHALVLGPDNVKWLEERKHRLPRPELLIARELDVHDLDYPARFFDGYFTVQVHEHLIAPLIHIGEVRYCSKDGAVLFVDACGTTNEACKMIWHTNLVPEKTVLEQWEFWGFEPIWRGPHGDQRPQFIFKMLPMDHPKFKNSGYLQHVLALRSGEKRVYTYHCKHCGT
jgi:hypothetical protein